MTWCFDIHDPKEEASHFINAVVCCLYDFGARAWEAEEAVWHHVKALELDDAVELAQSPCHHDRIVQERIKPSSNKVDRRKPEKEK